MMSLFVVIQPIFSQFLKVQEALIIWANFVFSVVAPVGGETIWVS